MYPVYSVLVFNEAQTALGAATEPENDSIPVVAAMTSSDQQLSVRRVKTVDGYFNTIIIIHAR